LPDKFEELINGFVDNELGISDHFLTAELAGLLQKDLEQMNEEGRLSYAGIGNNIIKNAGQKMRGDKIHWIDKKDKNINELHFLDRVEDFIDHLNRTCYTGINDYEFHFALYEAGSFYKRHKDQFKNDANRKFSLISYLNDDWLDTDGGQLLIYKDEDVQTISPNIGKAVFFKSNELEHEVTLSGRSRMSITGWLKRT